jgi:hypothetical protein
MVTAPPADKESMGIYEDIVRKYHDYSWFIMGYTNDN